MELLQTLRQLKRDLESIKIELRYQDQIDYANNAIDSIEEITRTLIERQQTDFENEEE